MSDDLVAWLREQIEGDKAAAESTRAGGFVAARWETEPAGQVNPAAEPGSPFISAAIGQELDYTCGWVRVVPWTRATNEPPEADEQEIGSVVALAERGRREFDHIARHDPRGTIARCEAELAMLEICERVIREEAGRAPAGDGWSAVAVARIWLHFAASGYRHRPGYQNRWMERSREQPPGAL